MASEPSEEQLTQRDQQVVRLYVEDCLSLEKIGARFKLDKATVRGILERAGVNRRYCGSRLPREQLTHRNQEIVRLYVEEGLTLREVGARVGLSGEGVRLILKEAGGPVRGVRRPIPPEQLIGSQEIIRLYVEEGLAVRDIRARFGLTGRQVSGILRRAKGSRGRPDPS